MNQNQNTRSGSRRPRRKWKGGKARRYRHKTDEMREIARERVEYLFERAMTVHETHPDRAQRYVQIARKVAMAARLRIPRHWKRRICHGCKRLIIPGFNCRYRLQSRSGKASRIVLTCHECGHQTRYYIKRGREPSGGERS